MKDDNGFTVYRDPDKIWCVNCHTGWVLLPGEYESIIENEIMPSCPLCGSDEMEFVGDCVTVIPE